MYLYNCVYILHYTFPLTLVQHVTHSGPEVFFKTCIAMKFVDDDDDDECVSCNNTSCRLWSTLPPDITSASTPTVFQNRLKTYLFSDHFLPNCFQFLVVYTVVKQSCTQAALNNSNVM